MKRSTLDRLIFDEVADSYDRARPSYPDELIDDLIELTSVDTRSRVLEIGPGTGQATLCFARRGLSLTCVEPGPRLAALARKNLSSFPTVRIIEHPFESWPLEPGAFDLVVSANALHWVDPAVRLDKAHAALKGGGALAVFSAVPMRGTSDLDREIDVSYDRLFTSHQSTGAERRGALEPQLLSCEPFRMLPVRRYSWEQSFLTEEYLELLASYSDHHLLGQSGRAWLFAAIRQAIQTHGGKLNVVYQAKLLIGLRVA